MATKILKLQRKTIFSENVITENPENTLFVTQGFPNLIREDGRTPAILSKYVEHSQRLYHHRINYADKVFLLSGANSKKEHREILKQMNQVTPKESMMLVAMGKLIGKGFDYPRLDTLIMATPVMVTPVAWKVVGGLTEVLF